MYAKYNNYDKFPEVRISGFDDHAFEGYDAILAEIKKSLQNKNRSVVVLDFYPGVDEQEVLQHFAKMVPAISVSADLCTYDRETYEAMIQDNLTDDRVFGVLTTKKLEDYFIADKLEEVRQLIEQVQQGVILVYGVGASLITRGDLLIYCDLARWEIQTRYKQGMSNYKGINVDEPFLSKYKRGFFVDWRLADRHKKQLFEKIDYVLDTNVKNSPKMITGEAFIHSLKAAAAQPFRVVPYFDPGVWGGQWMKDVCGLDPSKPNYAWSFDGVPEENSLYLRFGDVRVEIPSMDVIFYQPRQLLGEKVHSRFGPVFPIRFNFLDTMEGQNLSLQVHPLTDYIQDNFGMHYTQDESYYLLDCGDEDTYVYLGLKDNVNQQEMIAELKAATQPNVTFDAEKYVNKIPVKKHDHILIPAGTIHCSGTNTMVLEISASVYIFTFKLWDWGRLGLDGLPRPIHIEHGEQAIQWDRTTDWCYNQLVNRFEELSSESGIMEEKTGLHEREFIESRRHTFTKAVTHENMGSVNMLNLVEGEEAEVVSPTNAFEPFIVHYAETFIIPASVGSYIIRPTKRSEGQTLMTIKAYVR